jgi:hypothetical protein
MEITELAKSGSSGGGSSLAVGGGAKRGRWPPPLGGGPEDQREIAHIAGHVEGRDPVLSVGHRGAVSRRRRAPRVRGHQQYEEDERGYAPPSHGFLSAP